MRLSSLPRPSLFSPSFCPASVTKCLQLEFILSSRYSELVKFIWLGVLGGSLGILVYSGATSLSIWLLTTAWILQPLLPVFFSCTSSSPKPRLSNTIYPSILGNVWTWKGFEIRHFVAAFVKIQSFHLGPSVTKMRMVGWYFCPHLMSLQRWITVLNLSYRVKENARKIKFTWTEIPN